MKYILLVLLSFSFIACSGNHVEHAIEKGMIETSGNKPPASFEIANIETMRDYVFNTKDFSFSLPSAKQSDFTKMGGWDGMSMRDGKTIALGFKNSIVYHIELTFDTFDYAQRERAVESNNISYIKNLYHRYNPNTNISIQNYGKENYFCVRIEGIKDKYKYPNKKKVSYKCYKFNSDRTKAKSVRVGLTYNKPKKQTLAKQYTYKDLQKRAKRTLDSLYIKDGW